MQKNSMQRKSMQAKDKTKMLSQKYQEMREHVEGVSFSSSISLSFSLLKSRDSLWHTLLPKKLFYFNQEIHGVRQSWSNK